MKKIILSIAVFLLGMLTTFADNVSVADVTIPPGETTSVGISLNNTETNLVSFQMDLTLPEGITVNKTGCSLSSRFTDEDQELTIGRQANGDIRLTSTSFSLIPITGNSGEIITLSLTASAESEGGTVTISNIRFVTNNSERVTLNDASFNVIIPSPTIEFADDNVKALCVANWDTNEDGELSEAEAAAVTNLGEIFKGNTDITSFDELEYFTGLSEIGDLAFQGCSNLESVQLPEGLTRIGGCNEGGAFNGSGLRSIKFPSTLTEVGNAAFQGCNQLTSIDFNGCTATLEGDTFSWCDALENVFIPNTITLTGAFTFACCASLKTVVFEEGNPSEGIYDTFIGDYINSQLETVVLPSTSIMGEGLFSNCTSLKSVTFLSGEPGEKHFANNFQGVPNDVLFTIPDGTAVSFLKKGYRNLSDLSALQLVKEEFEAETTYIQGMANNLIDGDNEALATAISEAHAIVVDAVSYLTVYEQIVAIKTAAKAFLATATLPDGCDITAATIINPDADRFDIGWAVGNLGVHNGWQTDSFTNGDVTIDHFIEGRKDADNLNNGKIAQTITNLPAGRYRLEADIIATWSDGGREVTGVCLFIGNQSYPVATANQNPEHFSVDITILGTQDVEIGLKTEETNANWVAADNFRLYYIGATSPVLTTTASVVLPVENTENDECPSHSLAALDMQAIAEAIGTESPVIYGMGNNGNLIKGYTLTPYPGFWLDANGKVCNWGENPHIGYSFVNDHLDIYQKPGMTQAGETYVLDIYFVNESTGAYAKHTTTVSLVVNIPEAIYCLKNVETGKYLFKGNLWGTQAVLADEPLPARIKLQDDGSYTIFFPVGSQFQQMLYRANDTGVYVDYNEEFENACPYWTFTDAGNGNYYIQSLITDETYGQVAMPGTYLGNNPNKEGYDNDVDGNITNGEGMNITWTLEPLSARTAAQTARIEELINTAQSLGLDTNGEDAVCNNNESTYLDMLSAILDLQERIDNEINRINEQVEELTMLIGCANAINMNTDEAQAVADNPESMDAVNDAISTLRSAYIAQLGEGISNDLLPLDVTGAIVNPSFVINNADGWSWNNGEDGPGMSDNNAEYRERTFDFHQTISGLPNGNYILKVKGFHQPGNKDDVYAEYMQDINNAKAELYANNESVILKNVAAEAQDTQIDDWSGIDVTFNEQTRYIPCNTSDAHLWFTTGYYENVLPITVSNGTLTIGVRLNESIEEGWVIFDDFRLEYQGIEDEFISFDDDAVKNICLTNWDTNNDGKLSEAEAAAVIELGEVFKENTDITSFNELQYFTGLTDISDNAFERCTALTCVKLPSTLTRIGEWAFSYCGNLQNIDFNGCTVDIDNAAFLRCNALENLELSTNIRLVGYSVFNGCTGLRSVVVGENADESWADAIFADCTSLETIVLYSKNIGCTNTFKNCTSLRSVTFRDGCQGDKYFDQNFINVPSDLVFTIPEGTAEDYLQKGYVNLSDNSALSLVRQEFDAEATRIQEMADALNDGDKTTLTNAISNARTMVNAAEDYPTVFAQIAAIKSAARTYLTTATLPTDFDVTAATITNPNADRFAIGWIFTVHTYGSVGYENETEYSNENITINKYIHSQSGGDGKMYQIINNLPAGLYRLEADILTVADEGQTAKGNSLFAGNMAVSANTVNSNPEHFSVKFENPMKRDVTIGINITNSTANWVGADNFRLIYIGPTAAAPCGTELVSSEDNTYYIYNVGTGMYLSGGNGWGTQAVLAETGLPVQMTQDGDGYWQVYFREGSRNQQLLYRDRFGNILTDYNDNEDSQWKWIITETNGNYTIQSVDDSNNGYVLGNDPARQDIDLNGDITLDTHIDVICTDNAANNTQWLFISEADYDLMMAKRYLLNTIFRMNNSDADNETLLTSTQAVYDNNSSTYDEVVTATTLLNSQIGMPQENQPVDMTALIINPRFEYNTTEGWMAAKLTANGNANNTQSQTHEFYMTSFNMSQRITGIPNGLYRLKWKGFHRPGNCEQVCADFINGTNNASAVVYANDVEKTMKHIYTGASNNKLDESDSQYDGKFVPFRQWGARAYFDEGLYADNLEVEVTNNVLNIGIKNTEEMGEQHWVIFSDFELEILQNAETYNNHLSISDVSSVPGGSATLPINMANTDQIVSFSVEVRLPEGVVPKTDNNGNIVVKKSSRVPMAVSGSVSANGTCRFAALTNGQAISGNSGEIFSFVVMPNGNMELGEYEISLDNIKLINDQLLRIQPFDATSTLTLREAATGDVSGDGDIDILDATMIVYYVLGRNPELNLEAGDVNGDGEVDILDATIIMYHVLGRDTNPTTARQLSLPEPQ